jgi:L-malate glycosyltransferase
MDKALNIAHCVESYAPAPGGMPEVVQQLSERLVKLGHCVTVFTSTRADRDFTAKNGVLIKSFNISGNAVAGICGDTDAYLSSLKGGGFDVITFFAAQQWAADLALPRLREFGGVKVFVPTGFSQLHHPDFAGYYDKMKKWLKDLDMNVFLSHAYQDIAYARLNNVENVTVIPNGAAEEEFLTKGGDIRSLLDIPRKDALLLHVGSFTSTKGQLDALDIFLKSKLKNVTLLLVGNNPDNFFRQLWRRPSLMLRFLWSKLFSSRRIIATSLTRKDTVDAYRAADLFFFPSRIECSPIVLFEAMASSTPFLVTDVGNASEIVSWSEGGWIMPTVTLAGGFRKADIPAAAKALALIFADSERRRQAADSGHKAWKEKFTWQGIALEYEQLYLRLVAGKAATNENSSFE